MGRTQCERAKRQLSTQTAVTIEIDSLHERHDFSLRMSRAKFEELNMDYFNKAMEPVSQCLGDSNFPKSKISEVVMVGGSTRIPKVQEMIKAFFNGKELCKEINPDEAVAYGAAVQAAIVSGAGTAEVQNMLLLDVAPLSLGIEMAGGMMQKLIERNSTIPTNKSQDFTTAEDYQDYVDIAVYEGERLKVQDNNYLGKFTLNGIPKTIRGVPKIRAIFNIDSHGILEVTAQDTKSGTKGMIEITNEKGRLSQSDIEKMLEDAEKYKDDDDLARGEMVAKEALIAYVERTWKALEEIDEAQVLKRDKEKLEKGLWETDEWLKRGTAKAGIEDFQSKQKELESAMNAIMLRVNRAHTEIWEEQVELPEGVKTVENGGSYVDSGLDICDLVEDPE